MTGNIEKSAWILSIGMVISALILGVVIGKSAKTLSNGIITGGTKARSHFSGGSFPSHLQVQLTGTPDVRVQLAENLNDFNLGKRQALITAFEQNCIGKVYEEKEITAVEVVTLKVVSTTQSLEIRCKVSFADGSALENCYAYLYPDGIGGFEGNMLDKRHGKDRILEGIRVE